jgi:hypothetical protein
MSFLLTLDFYLIRVASVTLARHVKFMHACDLRLHCVQNLKVSTSACFRFLGIIENTVLNSLLKELY